MSPYSHKNNQLATSLATYDGAGNVIQDTRNAYVYDPEGRLCAVEANPTGTPTYTQYLYDAEGRRVAKGAGTSLSCGAPTAANGFTLTSQYLLGQSGAQVTELGPSANPATNWVHSNVWEGARLTATYSSAGLTFDIADPLGTKRVQAGISSAGLGVQSMNCLSLPFGNNIGNTLLSDCVAVGIGETDVTEHHFTGKERDTESGNDYFGARYYASSMGRFISPDWSAKAEPVPYASMDNPQSLDLYGYTRNSPLGEVDADGHCSDDGGIHSSAWCFFHAIGIVASDAEWKAYHAGTARGFIAANGFDVIKVHGHWEPSSSASDDDITSWWKDYNDAYQKALGQGFTASGAVVALAGGRRQGGGNPLTNAQVSDLAKWSGMEPVKQAPFDSHGQKVFRMGNRYFTPDVDGHIGGVWKEFDRLGNRIGTLDVNLTWIGK